jgi:hypothetical protein
MEQVVIIVIIGLISLVNWVVKRSAEIREERKRERERQGIPEGDPFHSAPHQAESPGSPHRPVIASSPDMRRLMEALGLPPEEEVIPPRPVVREAPPALPTLPAYRPPAAPKPRFQNPDTRAAAIPPDAAASPLAAALRSHDGIRQAIVLREILGPPKALAA